MFGTVVDKISTLLSRSFLLANFFPFLIFTVGNLLLIDAVVPGANGQFARVFTWDTGSQALLFAFIFVAIAVMAYIVAPLTVVVQQALEGKLLVPVRLQNRLRTEQSDVANRLKNARDEANQRDDDVSALADALHRRLVAANRTSSGLGGLGPDAARQIEAAETALAAVAAAATPGRLHDRATTDATRLAVTATETALLASTTRAAAVATDAERALVGRLVACRNRAEGFVRGAADDAREALIAAQEALRGRFAVKGIRPTRIANIRAAVEAYSNDAYQVEFEYIWPRLKLAMLKDDKVSGAIESAKTQVDFMLLMVLLSGLFTAGWIVMFTLLGRPLALIVLGVAGQVVILFFLRLVEESVKQLGQLVTATIDLYRFKLLAEMHIDLPNELSSERTLWQRLQTSTVSAGTVDIAYQHGKPS